MRSYDSIAMEVDCKHDYFDIWAGGVTFKTVALTFISIILAFSIEVVVHSEVNLTSKKKPHLAQEQLSGSETLEFDASPFSEESNVTKGTAKEKHWWCNPNPTPTIRANRFTVATILIIPLCVAFGLRIADTAPPDIRYECREILKSSIQPTWGAIILLNIIPFIIASFAWMRALIDCLVVRWGKTLKYPKDIKGSGIGWPPFAPLYFVVLLPIMGIREVVKKGAIWMMGSPYISEDAAEDIELGGEERVRLVDDVDDVVVDEGEAPPAYEGDWRKNGSGVELSQ